MIRIAAIPGDGIGPAVVREAVRALEAAADAGRATVDVEELPHSADHYLETGESLSEETLARLRDEFDAILFGAVGDPRVSGDEYARDLLLGLRSRLDLYVNFRPVRLRVPDLTPLRDPGDGIDIAIFRENTEGLYVQSGGTIRRGQPGELAISESLATRRGVERLVRAAFEHAGRHGCRRVTLADKANAVPHVYGLWRRVFGEVADEFPDLDADMRYADALAMELVRHPDRFDVVVAENFLGDLLSDLGAELAGGVGLAPSANLHPGRHGLFEPVHGSAPDLAGTGRANPVAAILSAALLLRDQGAAEAADRVEAAVDRSLEEGVRTADVGGDASTEEVGRWIADRVREG